MRGRFVSILFCAYRSPSNFLFVKCYTLLYNYCCTDFGVGGGGLGAYIFDFYIESMYVKGRPKRYALLAVSRTLEDMVVSCL